MIPIGMFDSPFVRRVAVTITDAVIYPNLVALTRRCEALPAFGAVKAEFFSPGRTS